MVEVKNFLLDDVFINIRPMTTDKLEGIDKDKIAVVDNFLLDNSKATHIMEENDEKHSI